MHDTNASPSIVTDQYRGNLARLHHPQGFGRQMIGIDPLRAPRALLKGAGLRHCDGARTGMVTYIQRFGSKLNLNVVSGLLTTGLAG